uniref:Mitochondrial inner membrane protein OXA1 n=1 Tax=Talaromyces marneffei PM1 TaxID=1077442 RepID=A0A093XDT3_TALMA
MADDRSTERIELYDSALTVPSDSENYSANNELSSSPPSTSSSPVIVYKPPTFWGLLRGTAINVVLPFVNGLMLGLGELLAHEAAFRLGWTNTKIFPTYRRTTPISPGIELRELLPMWNLEIIPAQDLSIIAGNMIGSRSLSRAAARGSARNISFIKPVSSARSLSSIASRPILSTSQNCRLRLKSSSYLPPVSVSSLSFARFNSTSTESAQATGDATPLGESQLPSIDDIPEKIGYLKDLGLDYGWGPSAFMEWLIEHIHIWGGMPWYASIAVAAIVTRLALFHPALKAADNAAKTSPIKDEMMELRKKRMQLLSQGRQLDAAKAKVELDDLYAKHDIKMWRNFVPLLQIPLGFGIFRVVRGMTTLPIPGLVVEEFAWIHDLTSYDPYYVLPILTSGFMYLAMRKGMDSGVNEMGKTALGRSITIGLPAMSLLFIAWQPAALQLYFAVSSLFSLGQGYLFNTPVTRKALGIAPAYKPPVNGEGKDSLRMIQQEFLSQMRKMNESGEVSGSSTKPNNISMLDKMVNNAKKEYSTMKKEMGDKVRTFTDANSSAKNHDGTPAAAPRLSAAEKQSALSYKAQREIEDAHELAERNRKRTQEYEAYIAQQQANANQAWKQKGREALKQSAKKSRSRK